ncbi:hypothetical protein BCR32DRAFT_28094 [Anaeromyces robustus]|jgi:hypothetical protein|uniref:Phosphatidylglycerol/phosphatidylinositol transfer protein n=1 Tax=Anaeromyces robustus TaxID=1754192 RepID=A0A1Y1XM34_9FUNG|nr:hypothetical protein BCR32DRAFT_28094 [Anaeromyces robustus]|eukprot:ORX86820.1 hypothetical protein BCR32DRAFT_28094 [Anaeromyces robustus]
MLLKSLILLVLAVFAYALPQDDIEVDRPDVDVDSLSNRIEFVSNFSYEPKGNVKEGDVIVVSYNPPAEKDAAKVAELVKSFTIAIGTGTGTAVDNEYFMESERLPIPTGPSTYKFQLPAQMENKQYCIVYTPSTDAATDVRPTIGEEEMECLYETWFQIHGSLEVGAGPKHVDNLISQDAQATTQVGNDQNVQNPVDSQVDPNAQQPVAAAESTVVGNEKSSSITISPAITAFIAVLFACFFI